MPYPAGDRSAATRRQLTAQKGTAMATARTGSSDDKSKAVEATAAEEAAEAGMTPEQKAAKAERIVKDHILMSTAAGVVPSPGFDLLAGFGVQVAMLARLSKLYGVPFTKNLAKNAILPLLTSVGGFGAARILGASAVKSIPLIGTALGAVSMPVTMGALTYGLGKVFSEHFASGGTFLDFNPKSWGSYFKTAFRRGKDVAAKAAEETKDAAAKAAA